MNKVIVNIKFRHAFFAILILSMAGCSENDVSEKLSLCEIDADKAFPEGAYAKQTYKKTYKKFDVDAANVHSNYVQNCMFSRGYRLDVEQRGCSIDYTFEWADRRQCYRPKIIFSILERVIK